MNIKITGSGSYIPSEIVTNKDFTKHVFLNEDGTSFPLPNEVITEKFIFSFQRNFNSPPNIINKNRIIPIKENRACFNNIFLIEIFLIILNIG
jgi:hypothetical protein